MSKNTTKPKEDRIEFSKKLAILISSMFVTSIIFTYGVWYFQDRDATHILDYIATPFGVVITGYFAKAGVENYTRIRHSNYSDSDEERI